MNKSIIVMALLALVSGLSAEAAKKKAVPARDISSVKGFKCSGTEPFFSVNLSGKNASVEFAGEKKSQFKTSGMKEAVGIGSGNVMSFQSTNLKNVVTVLSAEMAGSKCSDGMSDHEYAYHMVYVSPANTFTGCCDAE